MSERARNRWPVILALGIGFTFLNVVELAFLDGGWPQIVGAAIGFAFVAVVIAWLRGWEGVRR